MPAGDLGADLALLQDLALLKNVAREAGQLALDMMRQGAKAWDKSPGNPVTEADLAVNDLIAKRLRGARPEYGWLSEETKDNPADRSQPHVWVVDPIDGTKAFVKGDTGFCVAIARLDGKEPVAGVIYNPNFDELLHARLHGGAFLNDRPIRVSPCRKLGCRMVGQPDVFANSDAATRWPGVRLLRPIPNAVAWRLALVAAGRWDAAVALNPKNDWDLAAAVLLVREAGGIVTDRDGGDLVFNGPSVVHAGVVAAGAVLHPLIMERLHNRPAA
ncbi:MAG: 3'(2'),5'-bisphosphate nucleotidase CysQ [Hyphomonadaceae bacterium]